MISDDDDDDDDKRMRMGGCLCMRCVRILGWDTNKPHAADGFLVTNALAHLWLIIINTRTLKI